MRNTIFIHFLNRELLRSLDIKRISGANYALQVLLIAKDANIYIPLSSIWENEGGTDLDYNFFDLAYESKQIELISDCITVEEFLERNYQLYFFDKNRYPCYFENRRIYGKYRPTAIKKYGATSVLKNTLEKWTIREHFPLYLPDKDRKIIEANKEIICTINRNSENRGITSSLFRNKLLKDIHELSISRLLSVFYIKDYLKCIEGDIATGIDRYISYYDMLAKEFPYNDIPLLGTILECAGVDKTVFIDERYDDWFVFLYKRGNLQHERICTYISEIIGRFLAYANKRAMNQRIISNDLVISLRRTMSECTHKINKIYALSQMDELENNLKTILKCTEMVTTFEPKEPKTQRRRKMNNKVFIVHGHDDLLKEQLANWLYSLDLEPIILHKQANVGTRSIIDKTEKYSNVSCAIALLTGDDLGKGKEDKDYKKRARQNVIFEAGYFIGKIGVSNVILLYEDGVELPGDLGGCVYISADKQEGWKEKLRIEFNAMGISYKK